MQEMSTCCVSGCKYRYTAGSKIKLYRIPAGSRPYQANRRRLWLEAIQRANGSTEPIKDTARVCSAHFISGKVSMDYGMPDFVPSVFTCTEESPPRKKRVKRVYGRRQTLHRAAKMTAEEKAVKEEKTEDLQSSVFMETESELSMEMQIPSTLLVPKEEETSTIEAENDTKAIQSQTSNTDMPSPSFKVPAGIAELVTRSPIVLLKPIVSPAGGFQCEQCNLTFPGASQLVKHKQQHEEPKSLICEVGAKCLTSEADLTEHHAVHKEEPYFSCNICDRSFLSKQSPKRHKLLHVRDGRKCLTCGALFCRNHRHFSFLPKIKCKTESEEESFVIEPQHVGSDLIPENDPPNTLEPSQTTEESGPDDAQSSQTFTLLLTSSTSILAATPPIPEFTPETLIVPNPAANTRIVPSIPTPVSLKSSSMPPPIPAVIGYRRKSTTFQPRSLMATSDQPQYPELPPSLKIFSPQYLTSAFLEVKRNYDYIFSKKKDVDIKPIVKEEPDEPVVISKTEQIVEQDKNERIAYDLEIVL